MAKNETRKHRTRPPRGAASPTSARRLAALDKQRQALALRMAGASFDEIAESLGYADRGGAHKAVMAAIESALPEPALQVRELELKRLDRLWLAAWKAATAGDLQAITVCLQIMKRRADFEGLDKAKKLEHSGPGGTPIQVNINDTERHAILSAVCARLGYQLGPQAPNGKSDGDGPAVGGPLGHHASGQAGA